MLTYVVHSKSTWITRLDPAGRPHFRAGLGSGAACCRHDMTISQARGCVRVRMGGGAEKVLTVRLATVSLYPRRHLAPPPARQSQSVTPSLAPRVHRFSMGGGGTWWTPPVVAEVPALWSPDPGAGSAPCPDPRRDSPSVRVQWGGCGGRRRGRPGGGGG